MNKIIITNFLLIILLVFGFYKLYYINVDSFINENVLSMNNLDLEDKHIGNILKYTKENNIKNLELKGNNFSTLNSFLETNNTFYNSLDLRNNKNGLSFKLSDNKYSDLVEKYKKIELIYKIFNITPSNNNKYYLDDFYNDKKLFELYSKIKNSNNVDYIEISSNTNIINSNNNYFTGNLLSFLGDSDLFSKQKGKTSINLGDLLKIYDKKELLIHTDLIRNINNNKIELSYFNIDHFCDKYKGKLDCNILKNNLKMIGNNNINNILLNNNYIISNYLGINKNYNNLENQLIFLDIYGKLLNRNSTLNYLNFSNNYINNLFLDNIVLDFPNLDTINLSNLETNNKVLIDLDNTNIVNFMLLGLKDFHINYSNNKYHNILIDDTYTSTCNKKLTEDICFPDIFYDNNDNKFATKNLLTQNRNINENKQLGHYKFSEAFIDGLMKSKSKDTKVLDYFYNNYYKDLYVNKGLSDESFEKIWLEFNSSGSFSNLFDVKLIDFYKLVKLHKVDDLNYSGFYFNYNGDLSLFNEKDKLKIILNKLFKSDDFRIFIEDYIMYIKYYSENYHKAFNLDIIDSSKQLRKEDLFEDIKFKEIFKIGNTYIFIKN